MKKQKMVRVTRIAKLSGVAPTIVYNVLLAAYLEQIECRVPQKVEQ